jgi:putative SOS response-associated peptidase YedK
MCGRYSLTTPTEGLRALFGFDEMPNLPPRYNIAPTQDVAAVRLDGTEPRRSFTIFRWGLIPSWAKEPSIGSKMINARAETVTEKPAFRAAFRRRRCLIPADGFYEWEKLPDGGKQPWRTTLEGGVPFAFAGLWEDWLGADGSKVETCTIVTTEAAPSIAQIHHRMPVILDPGTYMGWLSGTPKEAQALLRPYRGALTPYRVSTRVNSVRNDDDALLEPVSAPENAEKAQFDLF